MGRAILVGGYGRKMKRTAISSDAPTVFINPETVPPPAVARMSVEEASITRVSKLRDPAAISHMLPGSKDAKSKVPVDKFRTFPCGKQVSDSLKCTHEHYNR